MASMLWSASKIDDFVIVVTEDEDIHLSLIALSAYIGLSNRPISFHHNGNPHGDWSNLTVPAASDTSHLTQNEKRIRQGLGSK